MPNSEFEKLVKEFAERSQKEEADIAVNWQETREWWIRTVGALFDRMEGWLGSLIASGAVKRARPVILLTERDLGRYPIQSLELDLAGKKLKFVPVGTLLVGAYGRIDVSGPTGRLMLVLRNTNDEVPLKERRDHVEWFITQPAQSVAARQRMRHEYQALTQDSFQQLFADLFGIMP